MEFESTAMKTTDPMAMIMKTAPASPPICPPIVVSPIVGNDATECVSWRPLSTCSGEMALKVVSATTGTAVLPPACNAKAAGGTHEEIVELAFCACYSVGKAKMQEIGACMTKVFGGPTFQSIEALAKQPAPDARECAHPAD